MKTALIGLGRIGWAYHLQEILSHSAYQLCAVVDPCQERLDEAAGLYSVNGYTGYAEMLQNERPELVVIASPTLFHEEQAIAAMEAGADVLLDKPMALNLDAARHIAQVREKTGRKLVVYQPRRFTSDVLAAKALIASGKLGPIFQLRAADYGYNRRDDWQAFRKNGGGMLSNYGAHYIDQLVYLSGSKVTDICCKTQRILSMGDAEDVVRIVMQTENGIVLDVDINQATSLPAATLKLYGTNGTAELSKGEDGRRCLLVRYCDPAALTEKVVTDSMAAKDRRYPSEQIQWMTEYLYLDEYPPLNFYEACEAFFMNGGPSPVPLEETLAVMELLDKGYAQNA